MTDTNPIIAGMLGLLAEPDAWTKHASAGIRTKTGEVETVDERSPDATCFCLTGARARVRHDLGATSTIATTHALHRAIRELFPDRVSENRISAIVSFNDHPDTTHADVLAVLTKAQSYGP
jgi:hypothetical protein